MYKVWLRTILRSNLVGFKKGQSGNPGGKPKQNQDVTELARAEAPAALARLIDMATNCHDIRTRLAANIQILDRAYGKPAQAIDMSGKIETEITVIVKGKTP